LSDGLPVAIGDDQDDFEDIVMPTDDDEGVCSYSHTQKIPISLIKKQDKASVSGSPLQSLLVHVQKLFQPLPHVPSQQAHSISGSMLSSATAGNYGAYG
jgi:hypothetical protein